MADSQSSKFKYGLYKHLIGLDEHFGQDTGWLFAEA